MSICDVCGQEHPVTFNWSFVGDNQKSYICPTCYLLTQPSYNQLKRISPSDIQNSKYPALNKYLYSKLCSIYSMPSFNDNSGSRQNSQNSRRKAQQREQEQSKNNNTVINISTLPDRLFFGRENDIANIFNILGRKNKRNPLILGPSGVGKTAIVHHIAKMMSDGSSPTCMKGREVYELNSGQLVAGTKYRGDLEEKILRMFEEIESKDAILFIDNIHNISILGGSSEDNFNLSSMLVPLMENNRIQVIGATTTNDYRRTIESNKPLARLFQTVYIEEQPISEVTDLIKNLAPEISSFHGITIPSETIEDCVKLADQYIKYRSFPDKALDLLDMSCSRKKNLLEIESSSANINEIMHSEEVSRRLKALPQNIDIVTLFMGDLGVMSDLAECSRYLQSLFDGNETAQGDAVLNHNDLSQVVEFWTKIPVKSMSSDYKKQLKNMSPEIKSSVVGQDEAVDAVVAAICRRKLGIAKTKRPASFIFVGETGIGKTELAKALTKCMFGAESKMIRFDMSEYMEPHSVSKLIGAPPGYVGYNDAGQLTDALRRNPFSVVLFDEIEKAHNDVSNILLQVLDDGRITDAKGEVIDASNAIIILTSNAGANLSKSLGFGRSDTKDEESFKKGLMSAFRPEFLGRVDSIITFNNLTDDNYREIAKLHMDKIVANMYESQIELTYSDDVLTALCQKANTAKYHAREIARTVVKLVEDAIAAAILDSDDDEQIEYIHLAEENGKIKVLINNNCCAAV